MESVRRTTARPWRRTLAAGGVAVLLLGGAGAVWWTTSLRSRPARAAAGTVARPIVMPGEPVTEVAPAPTTTVPGAPAAQWSVEIASVNSQAGAMARVRQVLDSLPVPTFAPSHPGGGAATWYRLRAGAFTTSEAADSLLAALRARGALGPAAGAVVQAPLAWQLEEAVPDDLLPARLFAWRQQGLPAYALIDPAGITRVYVGAFSSPDEARLLTPMLDSLNLYATLVTRVGSAR